MLRNFFFLLFASVLSFPSFGMIPQKDTLISGEEQKSLSTIKLHFHGDIEARLMYDSYQSKKARKGILYFMPLPPNLDPDGNDLNKDGELNFSVFSSKLKFGADGLFLKKAAVSSYLEVDFLGTSDASLQIVRMRHAYFRFKWKNDDLLIGQTSHLLTVNEVLSNTVLFGGGVPFNTLHRGVQIQYAHTFSSKAQFLFSAGMYGWHNAIGPEDAQAKASFPDVHAQMKLGSTDRFFWGFSAGMKFLQPRSKDARGYKVETVVPSYDVSAFMRANLSGYTLKAMALYGENLSMIGMVGGYGKLLADDPSGDYGYANTRTLSTWVDFETPSYGDFSLGVFVGYLHNFGSAKALDLTKDDNGKFIYGYFRDLEVDYMARIAPRVYYKPASFLTIGAEYSYFTAQQGSSFSDSFQSLSSHPRSANHRVELLARFSF